MPDVRQQYDIARREKLLLLFLKNITAKDLCATFANQCFQSFFYTGIVRLLPGAEEKCLAVFRQWQESLDGQMQSFAAVRTAVKQKNFPVRRNSKVPARRFLLRQKIVRTWVGQSKSLRLRIAGMVFSVDPRIEKQQWLEPAFPHQPCEATSFEPLVRRESVWRQEPRAV